MKWKYYLPHIWESTRTVWEDVYLLPEVATPSDPSLWLTIDALGSVNDREEDLKKLGDANYRIDDTETTYMLVRAEDFNKAELLEWVKIWLRHNDLPVSELVEAPLELFAGTNPHAEITAAAQQEFKNRSS